MNLTFTDERIQSAYSKFMKLLPDSLTMNQYELAELTSVEASVWSELMHDGQFAKWRDSELALVLQSNQAKLMSSAADNDRSVGAAQMLNAITKMDAGQQAEQNFFIYSYVPLTPNECKAQFVREENEWKAPEHIVDIEKSEEQDKINEMCSEEVTPVSVEEKKEELTDEDWW